MARLASAGAVLLVAVAAACGGSTPTQPDVSNKVEKGAPPVVTAEACIPSNIQIRQVFAGTARWVTSLGAGDKTWNRGHDMFCGGNYYFEDFMLIVPAGKTTSVEWWGGNNSNTNCSNSPAGKLGDPYLYAFDFETKAWIASDDDGGCGFNSYFALTNESSVGKRYIIRVTTFGTFGTGLGQLVIRTPDTGGSQGNFLW